MKSILFAAAATFALSSHPMPPDPALAPFTKFIDSMDTGDTKTAASTFATSPTIIDEFGPHIWNSFAGWNKDLGDDFKKNAVTDFHIALSHVTFERTSATAGYAVVPSTLTYKVKGKAVVEKGLFTVSTAKTATGWQITGWAWSTL